MDENTFKQCLKNSITEEVKQVARYGHAENLDSGDTKQHRITIIKEVVADVIEKIFSEEYFPPKDKAFYLLVECAEEKHLLEDMIRFGVNIIQYSK